MVFPSFEALSPRSQAQCTRGPAGSVKDALDAVLL
jgi:hypothetical protein